MTWMNVVLCLGLAAAALGASQLGDTGLAHLLGGGALTLLPSPLTRRLSTTKE